MQKKKRNYHNGSLLIGLGRRDTHGWFIFFEVRVVEFLQFAGALLYLFRRLGGDVNGAFALSFTHLCLFNKERDCNAIKLTREGHKQIKNQLPTTPQNVVQLIKFN